MTGQDTGVKCRGRQASAPSGAEPAWPGDPESIEARDVDFEAVAHVLAKPLMHMAPVARVCHQMLRLGLGRGNG